MRLKSFMKSSGIAALAAGLAALSVPSAAMAAPGDNDRSGWQGRSEGRGGGEGRGGNANRGDEARQERQQPAPQAQQQQAPPRNWGGDRNGNDPGRGWGSQRPAEGQRYGRDGGTVNRPEPANRNRAPEVQVQRDRPMWRAPDRNVEQGRTNTREAPRQQGWDGRRWQGQNWDNNRNRDRDWRNGQRWDNDRRDNWNRDWRRDNRYNWQSYRNSNRTIFRMGRYYAPYRDYSYRRLSIGFYLDTLFFSQNYWISDPYMYRLPPAYGPYRWVRYYDDALLVNIYDGEVVDVLYDFFW